MSERIPLDVWRSKMTDGTLGNYLNALDQHPASALAQVQEQQLQNSLAEYQHSLLSNSLSLYRGTSLTNTNPYCTPERMSRIRTDRASDIAENGRKIIEKISFWSEIPVVGAIVANRLADRLETISDRIEEMA